MLFVLPLLTRRRDSVFPWLLQGEKRPRSREGSGKDLHLAGSTGSPLPSFTFHRYQHKPHPEGFPPKAGISPSPGQDRPSEKGIVTNSLQILQAVGTLYLLGQYFIWAIQLQNITMLVTNRGWLRGHKGCWGEVGYETFALTRQEGGAARAGNDQDTFI